MIQAYHHYVLNHIHLRKGVDREPLTDPEVGTGTQRQSIGRATTALPIPPTAPTTATPSLSAAALQPPTNTLT